MQVSHNTDMKQFSFIFTSESENPIIVSSFMHELKKVCVQLGCDIFTTETAGVISIEYNDKPQMIDEFEKLRKRFFEVLQQPSLDLFRRL